MLVVTSCVITAEPIKIFVRVRIFWTSNIFVIIVFPNTHDTGAVTGTEPGAAFYTLPLVEINTSAFQPFNTALFKSYFNFIFFLELDNMK